MDQNKLKVWTRRGVVLGLLGATASIGCSPLNLAAFLFARDEKETAQYPLTFDKDSPKKDKEEIVVLLLPHVVSGINSEYPTVDRDLVEKLSKMFPDMMKENKDKKKMRVISPSQLDKFRMSNHNFQRMPVGEIGAKLGADFVLEIELSNVQLYQPNTPGEKIPEGRADVAVNIYEIDKNDGTRKDGYSFTFTYPDGIQTVSFTISPSEFKQKYIEKLAYKIALYHIDHKKTNTFGSGEGASAR